MKALMAIALWLAAATAHADLYGDMRARFQVYPAICIGRVECVLERMQLWFGRTFEARTSQGVTCVYYVRRDGEGQIVELELVGEI